jgi:hypothetical protein
MVVHLYGRVGVHHDGSIGYFPLCESSPVVDLTVGRGRVVADGSQRMMGFGWE